jgi:hypothetical protein
MRVTIDLDRRNLLLLWLAKIKGFLLLGRMPDLCKRSATGKGWHLTWQDLPISEGKMFAYRKLIGDDKNRIRLDQCSRWRMRQVLFDKKTVTYNV